MARVVPLIRSSSALRPLHMLLLSMCLFGSGLSRSALPESPLPADSLPATTLKWDELLPEQERTGHALAPPPPLHDYLSGESGPAAKQPLDFSVNPALDGRRVRLPGFIVPLDLDPYGKVSEFLLVPYVGACIHVPPPPPNQVIYVILRTPFVVSSMYSAYWITGRLQVSTTRSPMAVTAYTVRADDVQPYRPADQTSADGTRP